MSKLHTLPPFDSEGHLRVVVESPRGSGWKLKYEPELGLFITTRALPTGLTYPSDWGFVPGTEAEDGDPLDALVLSDIPAYPGVVIPSRALGLLKITQKEEKGQRQRNDRLIAVPLGYQRFEGMNEVADLPKVLREEIQQFFLNTTFHTGKDPKVLGWGTSKQAIAAVKKAARSGR